MNCVSVSGRLGADPDLKASQSGTYWMAFSLAVNAGRDKTVWLDCKAFGKTAELISSHFKKGEGIEIIGEFDVEEWEDKNGGGTRKKNVVTVRAISFCPVKRDQAAGDGGQPRQQSQQQQRSAPSRPGGAPAPRPGGRSAPQPTQEEIDIDDIPF